MRRPAKTCPVCESGARVLDYKDERTLGRFLTERGKKFVVEAKHCIDALTDEYRALLGKKNYDHMISMMTQIIEYNAEKQGVPSYLTK